MLPQPDAAARQHSAALTAHIARDIAKAGGWIDFARYMELALYAPGLGYYAAGATKFGAAGDFVTAPELTPLFGRTVAHQVAQILGACGGDVVELGAGSGRLAIDLLGELARIDALPRRYRILEVSAELAARQRTAIAAAIPQLAGRVEWLSDIPHGLRGVVLANEVFDALPVHVVRWQGGAILERGVAFDGARLVWETRPSAHPGLVAAARRLPIPADEDYTSEIGLAAPALVQSLGAALDCGALLFFDYGFPRAEYYHPQRTMGTLRAHYRHHALDDPFHWPGLCDLTAHVDFSALAEAGSAAGLTLAGYTSQANFLVNAGIAERIASPDTGTARLVESNAVQRLVSPAEMGELFKVIAFTRGIDLPLAGFIRGDRRHRL
jgi:SAM-dependent MidA family methyltransferase